MSNLANYSPYNKTYKFLMFQNQAYHEKNKQHSKPCVKTNIRYPKKASNPESNEIFFSYQRPGTSSSPEKYDSPSNSQTRSMLLSSNGSRKKNIRFSEPKRIIHKHQSFEKFEQQRIKRENNELVGRLVGTSCEVMKNKHTNKSFNRHLKYKNIRAKFDETGNRKHVLAMGNTSLLCPTLTDFNNSGLGEKFLELDMSLISKSPSPSPSPKRRSIFSNR